MFYEKWQQNQVAWPSLQSPCCCSYTPARQVQASLNSLKPSHPLEFSVLKISQVFFFSYCLNSCAGVPKTTPGLWWQDSCYLMCFLEDFPPTESVAMGVAMPAKQDAVMDTVLCLPAGRSGVSAEPQQRLSRAAGCLQDTDWWSVSY